MSNFEKQEPSRRTGKNTDPASIEVIEYNEATGSRKIMIVEPVVKKAVIATDSYPFGSFVKVTGTTYTLDCLGRAYSPTNTYRKNSIVTQGGFVYLAKEDGITGAFNTSKWRKVANKTVGPVSIGAGSLVCTGRWHNSVSAIGFLIDETSTIE